MNRYLSGSDVTLQVEFTDKSGIPVYPLSASYVVYDEGGNALTSATPLTFESDDASVAFTIDGTSVNTIQDVSTDLRKVTVSFVTATGTVSKNLFYILDLVDELVIWTNTFQTYATALLNADDISNLKGWDATEEEARSRALKTAFSNICKLTFYVKDYLSFNFGIEDLTEDLIAIIPASFFKKLKAAQIIEANAILGGHEFDDRRSAGIMAETIGESSMMFVSGKKAILPTNRRTIEALAPYVVWGVSVNRAS